ncbi:MAG: hypothetical protein ACRDTE_22155 [Pseudonocardiaceae bacterium]
MGISEAEANKAFADSGPLYDFTVTHRADNRFGAVWVSYEGGYQVHFRYLDPSFRDEFGAALESRVGAVEFRQGGASSLELLQVAERLRQLRAPVAYGLNFPEGTVDLHQGSALPRGLIDAAHVRRLDSTPLATPQSNSGADIWDYRGGNWFLECTAGWMYKGPGVGGYGTAGHCRDGANFTAYVAGQTGLYSSSSNPFAELCPSGGGDYQMSHLNGGSTQVKNTAMDKRTYPHPLFGFAIAGGYYVGQPTLKMGLFNNGANGSNTGAVTGFTSVTVGANPECPSGTMTGLEYNNLSAAGDSGGPIFLSYAGSWFLGATHVAAENGAPGAPGRRWGQWVPWIPLPSGFWICTVSNPCN